MTDMLTRRRAFVLVDVGLAYPHSVLSLPVVSLVLQVSETKTLACHCD